MLIGGGHANLAVLKAARPWTAAGVRVTLITDQRFLYYSGMTPEHVRGVYAARELSIDLLRWCLVQRVTYLPSAAVRIDPHRREVHTVDGSVVPYDLAAADVGGIQRHGAEAGGAVRVKPLTHIERLITWLDGVKGGTLVVVGGGAAGTELALNASARPGVRARLILLEPGERLLGHFAPALGERARRRLESRGVQVRFGSRVERLDGDVLRLQNGEHLHADLVVWATGTRGHPMFRESGLEVDDHDFLKVRRTLQLHGHPELLAAGDCTSVDGLTLDRSGVNAVAQGLTMRHNVAALLRGWQAGRSPQEVRLRSFRPYPASPYLISTGSDDALLALGPALWARGRALLQLKHLADRVWINRYRLGAG